MNSNSKNVFPVVLKDANGRLRSDIFASREGLVVTSPLEFETGIAVKAVVNGLGAGDFVVRSVRAGKIRKVEVLAGEVPVESARLIPGFADIDENHQDGTEARTAFRTGSFIVIADGETVAQMPGAVRVAA